MSTFTAVLNTVYETLTHDKINTDFYPNATPTIEVSGSGASINIYGSNESSIPANAAAMTLLQDSPYVEGFHTLNGAFKWILFETAAGSPTVKTNNCIKI